MSASINCPAKIDLLACASGGRCLGHDALLIHLYQLLKHRTQSSFCNSQFAKGLFRPLGESALHPLELLISPPGRAGNPSQGRTSSEPLQGKRHQCQSSRLHARVIQDLPGQTVFKSQPGSLGRQGNHLIRGIETGRRQDRPLCNSSASKGHSMQR